MKTKILIFIAIFLLPIFGFSQSIENVEYISPFHDEVAAIEKGDQWAFIDMNGNIVVDYRNDLVAMKLEDKSYPFFNDGLCLISELKDGIRYFGYINKSGTTVIEPQFLNATEFQNGMAIVLELIKRNVGTNQLLKKPLVSYDYFEAIINTEGKVIHYLVEEPVHITLDKKFLKKTPPILSRLISEKLIAQLNENNRWVIKKIE